MVKKIKMNNNNLMALIDDEDYDLISQYKWHAHTHIGDSTWYACHTINYLVESHRLAKTIFMHRIILSAKKGEICDHINGDGLDNRRCNLRLVTRSQNQMNRKKKKNSKSKYKGVFWHSRNNNWQVEIGLNGKTIHLGDFIKEEEGARIYDKAAKKYYGKYARLNFPEELE